EKEALGFYVTSHPLTQHAEILDRYATADAADLGRPEFADGTEVILGGIITKMRTVITKNGRKPGAKMGIVTIEDLSGSIEIVFFPSTLEEYRAMIAADRVAFFRGEVDRRREEPSLRVSEVIPIEDAADRLSQWAMIRLRCVGIEERLLQQLQAACTKHPGPTPLYLHLTKADGIQVSIRSKVPPCVKPDEAFVREIGELLGQGHVVIGGLPRRVPRRRAEPATVASTSEGQEYRADSEEDEVAAELVS
ncbi:MAG: hypothetical protein JXQ73_12520, partial [Phycisphaerae bacterium]|nr:hypothetical protein [Phycisphaerae bacterium]